MWRIVLDLPGGITIKLPPLKEDPACRLLEQMMEAFPGQDLGLEEE